MIIHFVAEAFEYSTLSADAGRIDMVDECHDPMSGLGNFHELFSRIDGKPQLSTIRVDCENVKQAFWDREEFIAAIRELCEDDVYVQSSSWYSMKIGFVRAADKERFEQRLAERRGSYDCMFSNTLHAEIMTFLRDNDVTEYEYRVVNGNDSNRYEMRDPTIAGLLRIKFVHTKQGDHSKPPVPLDQCAA
jgi:hypothetical protein